MWKLFKKRKSGDNHVLPPPYFFTYEEVERMNNEPGSYQFKGDDDGKETETDGH